MFLISSLITSREVFFCERRLQKTEPYQSPRAFRACTDFGSLLTKKESAGRLFCRQIPSFSVIYISFLS